MASLGQASSELDGVHRQLVADLGASAVSTNATVLEQHGTDESYRDAFPPDIVVFPRTVDDVVAVVRACRDARVPIIPFGAGTSLEGHIAATRGGVSVDMSRMDNIRDIRIEDLLVTAEAGVTRLQLERALGEQGLFFPVDPGADATLGGMVATGASGTMTTRYGTMRETVVSLTVVLPDGDVVRTRSLARKSSAGYDLTHLFIGSEGTLGIITDVTLRVEPIPEAVAAAVCSFPSVADAVACVVASRHHGLQMARMELMDEVMIDAINARSDLELARAPTLVVECHGTQAAVSEEAATFAGLAGDLGGRDIEWSTDPTRRAGLWRARHAAYPSAIGLRPGARGIPSDVCVPISALGECITVTQADIATYRLTAPIIGHVGDGNFHVIFVLDPDDADEMRRYALVNDRLVRRAIELGGTCTGEHGVGRGKARYLPLEHGDRLVGLMAGVKDVFDPDGLMNPGKLFRA